MGDVVELRSGLATTVGPVPFDEPRAAAEFVLATQPELPTVPTAGTGPASLLGQAVDGLPGLRVRSGGMLAVDDGFDPSAATAVALDGELGLGPADGMLRGFLDGRRGFLLATLYAYYVLVRSVKAWERRETDPR